MFFYVFNFFLLAWISLLGSVKKVNKSVITVIVILILFAIAAMRGPIDNDYNTYKQYFTQILHHNYFTYRQFTLYEPAYYFIPRLAEWMSSHYFLQISFALFALLGVTLKVKALNELSNSFFLSCLLYISGFYILHEMTQVRVGVAAGFLLLSLKYVERKELSRFLLFILLASLFHYSSVLFLPVYFFSANTFNRNCYILLLIAVYLLAIFKINIINIIDFTGISYKISVYVNATKNKEFKAVNIWNLNFLLHTGLVLLFILKRKIFIKHNAYFYLMLKLQILSLVMFVLFASIPVFAFRTSELFAISNFCLIPSLIYLFKSKAPGYALVMLFCLLNIYMYFINQQLLLPYHPMRL